MCSECAVSREGACACDSEATNQSREYEVGSNIITVNIAVQCVYSLGYLSVNKLYNSLRPKIQLPPPTPKKKRYLAVGPNNFCGGNADAVSLLSASCSFYFVISASTAYLIKKQL